jgi:hypothetical protein
MKAQSVNRGRRGLSIGVKHFPNSALKFCGMATECAPSVRIGRLLMSVRRGFGLEVRAFRLILFFCTGKGLDFSLRKRSVPKVSVRSTKTLPFAQKFSRFSII